MSVKWACDFPGCQVASSEHKGWERVERHMPRETWLLFAIPILGTAMALGLMLFVDDGYLYCPTHAAFLSRNERREEGDAQ